MNYLQLVQRTVEKCGISGAVPSLSGQRGEIMRVINWVNEAWLDIQLGQPNWDWMREEFSFQTTAGQRDYTPTQAGVPLLMMWHLETLRTYKTSEGVQGEQFLVHWKHSIFRDTYMLGTPETGRAMVFTVKPRGSSLLLGPVPDGAYTVRGEYQRKPRDLVEGTDVPDMPTEYHLAIVHLARIKYAAFENAPEVMMEASRDYDRIMSKLSMTQLPDMSSGEPLA
jgi:hypothetical protein